jgi:transposase
MVGQIDPEVAIRLMLAGLLTGIVHDRKLMREAHVNIAIRWFAGYGLYEKRPDHLSLTRIRQRGAVPESSSAPFRSA